MSAQSATAQSVASLQDIQRQVIAGLRQVRAEYAPQHLRYALSATPEPENFGRIVVEQDLFIFEAIMTESQFYELRDFLNNHGVWLNKPYFKPYGRTFNKFEYSLSAKAYVNNAALTERRVSRIVKCKLELIGEDPVNPTMGLVLTLRGLADQLEAEAKKVGSRPTTFELKVEGEHTRGRGRIVKQENDDLYPTTVQLKAPRFTAPAPRSMPTPSPTAQLSGVLPRPIPSQPQPEPSPLPKYTITTYGLVSRTPGFVIWLPERCNEITP